MQTATTVFVLLAALATAVAGGVYLGFSAMVMPALRESSGAAETMNRIDVRAPRSLFMLPFLGSAATCLVAGILVFGRLPELDAVLVLVGAAAGIAGFLITSAVNVPLNNRLAQSAADAAAYTAFEGRWRSANALRGWVSVGGAAALTAALAV